MRPRSWSFGVALVGAGFVGSLACLSPTQLTLHVTTDVDCSRVVANGTAIFRGAPHTDARVARSGDCTVQSPRNSVGTLVVAPSGDNDARIDITVVMGVDVSVEGCLPPDYKGCIVARRRVRYVPHEALDMPVDLRLECKDIACNPEQTCFRGACISSAFTPVAGCVGPDCDAIDVLPTSDGGGSTPEDAPSGVVDAPSGPFPDVVVPPVDSGPRTLTRQAPVSMLPRGLAIDAGALLWVEPSSGGGGVVKRVTLPALTNVTSTILIPCDAYGIAVSGSTTLVSCRDGNLDMCGYDIVAESPSLGPTTCPGGAIGVALAGTDRFYTAPGAWFNGTSVPSHPGTGYVELSAARYWYGASHDLVEYDSMAGGVIRAHDTGIAPNVIVGIAASPTHVFVSTSDRRIIAFLKQDLSKSAVLSSNELSSVEDLAFDDVSGSLYIAAQIGALRGIYVLAGFASQLP